MKEKYRKRFIQLIEKLKSYHSGVDDALLMKAFDFSYDIYEGQLYLSGFPYIQHCIHVAEILVDLKMDQDSIIGGLMHAIARDDESNLPRIQKEFGDNIYSLVSGFYQITGLKLKSDEIKQEDILRKLILSIAKDLRVIIIKFADQLEKMYALTENMDQRNEVLLKNVAQESMVIYAPLAHRLGISKVKEELEDLSFKFMDCETYNNIKSRVAESKEEQEKYIQLFIAQLKQGLMKAGLKAEVSGRSKSIYSIHRKMVNRGYSFDKINDILAIRVIVEENDTKGQQYKNCYTALGVVQNLFTPIQELYTDYIQNPRENGYQSIHIKVIFRPESNGLDIKKVVEVQIRTNKMHEKAETGIAAHWLYKEKKDRIDEIDEKLTTIRQRVLEEAKDPDTFIKSLSVDDLFQEEIFVFSPDKDLWQLPKNSTPLDFAFHVHTDVGLHCIGAKVNGKLVQLNSVLQSGDTVEIITSKTQKPNRDWLSFVKTNKARSKIKKWIRDSQFEESVKLGEELLEKACKTVHITLAADEISEAAKKNDYASVEKLYAAIALGEITTDSILRQIHPDLEEKAQKGTILRKLFDRPRSGDRYVQVQGLDNLLINFAKCCQPLPGDNIIGFVTKGRGVVIHRTDCRNVPKLLEQENRNIDVRWAVDSEQRFVAKVNMIAENNRALLKDVTDVLASLNIPIVSADFKTEHSLVRNVMAVEVLNVNHLNRVINRMRKIKGVIRVERMDGNGNYYN